MKVQVSELIVKFMEKIGIDSIFGMPGTYILPVYDNLYDSSIKSVLAKHEQGAAFMACGYTRHSGNISACIATAGPGATNLITGIANAYADKQPILAITGETPTYIFGKGGLQESTGEGGSINQLALFSSITKYAKVIERTDHITNVLNRTAKILLSDNSGPVLLSIPYNVQKEIVDLNCLNDVRTTKSDSSTTVSNTQIKQLSQYIINANHPVIVSGYGCLKSGAEQLVTQLSQQLNIPVTSSLNGKGSINEYSPLSLGSLGVTSNGYAYDYIVNTADLIIVLGASFNERTSYLWNKNLLNNKIVIQIDINNDQLEKVFQADMSICADIKHVLTQVVDELKTTPCDKKQLIDIPEYKKIYAQDATASGNAIFQTEFSLVEAFFEKMNQQFPTGISIFDDNIIFAQDLLMVSTGNRYYPNSGISSLGHALPAAIGAQFAEQGTMFVLIGDGGFQMCCMEIMTAVNYDIPLNIILFNNASMGLIRKNQVQAYKSRFIDCDFTNPDYASLAQSFGIKHTRVDTKSDLDYVFENTNFQNNINLIEIIIDKNAFPNYSSRR